MIATDKQKLVRTELENAIAQPKESLATNAINVIEQTNIMEIQSKTHVFVSFCVFDKEMFIFKENDLWTHVSNNAKPILIYR